MLRCSDAVAFPGACQIQGRYKAGPVKNAAAIAGGKAKAP